MTIDSDSVPHYISKVNSLPMLSEQEEVALCDKVFNEQCQTSEDKLVTSYLRIVPAIARQYKSSFDIEDLIQEGNIALMRAVKSFDPSFKVRLSGYAMKWVKYAIQDYMVKNWSSVKIITTKPHRKIFFNLWRFKQDVMSRTGATRLSHTDLSEFASKFNVTVEDVLDMEVRLNTTSVSFDSDDDNEFVGADMFLTDYESNPETVLIGLESLKRVTHDVPAAMSTLTDREKDIVNARWIDLDDSGKSVTLEVLSERYAVSKERIRQIETSALTKIRKSLQ